MDFSLSRSFILILLTVNGMGGGVDPSPWRFSSTVPKRLAPES